MRERKYTVNVQCSVRYALFNVGNVLLCVIYQSNFTVFMSVTRISLISCYITLNIAFGIIRVLM